MKGIVKPDEKFYASILSKYRVIVQKVKLWKRNKMGFQKLFLKFEADSLSELKKKLIQH